MQNQGEIMQIRDLKQDSRNYRIHGKKNLDLIRKSVDECGFGRSVVIDNENEIICGNGLISQCDKDTKIRVVESDGSELIVVKRTDLKTADEKRKRLAVMDNSASDSSEFDIELLNADFEAVDLEEMGIDLPEVEDVGDKYKDGEKGSLGNNFLACPFSVLKSSSWQERKKQWLNLGIKSEVGRGTFYEGLGKLQNAKKEEAGAGAWASTSIFDPVLCELMYSWFSKKSDFIIDPFAGGSVRGIVANKLGRNYTGIDLRPEQIEANKDNSAYVVPENTPTYICGDSNDVLDTIADDSFDMCLSCPPYADLEVYSDNPADLSNMGYKEFISVYSSIISKLYKKLKDNSFVVWVIGEVRDKSGNYYNFLGDTIKAFRDSGFNYYNEIVLETMLGTAMMRAGKVFRASRKACKVHQNVLVFVKGDGKKASQRLGDVEIKDIDEKSLDIGDVEV